MGNSKRIFRDRLNHRQSDDTGFTLTEMIIVVVILGIIAAILIVLYSGQQEEAREAAVIESANNGYSTAVTAFTMGEDYAERVESISTSDIAVSMRDEGTVSSLGELCVAAQWTGAVGDNYAEAGPGCDDADADPGDSGSTPPPGSPNPPGQPAPPNEDEEEEDPEELGTMRSTWRIDYSRDNALTLTLGVHGGVSGEIDWGDGTVEPLVNRPSHTYSSPGDYEVVINGDFGSWSHPTSDMPLNQGLLRVSEWEDTGTTNATYAFASAPELQSVVEPPDTVTNMQGLFYGSSSFNQNIGDWDTSRVTNMNYMFRDATSFNGDISGWDVSNVSRMMRMFYNAREFNQDIGGWDVGRVVNMTSMFREAHSFNQDISSWDVSSATNMTHMFYNASLFNQDIGDWEVGNVTDMRYMFWNASSFNYDISSWDVSNVRFMDYMFRSASSFNQDISRWDVSAVTSMNHMFRSASSFDQDISGWEVGGVNSHTYFSADSPLSDSQIPAQFR